MHGLESALDEARLLAATVEARSPSARVAIFPPATLLSRLAHALEGLPIEIGGQDCRPEPSGAFTGDVSPEMLVDAGASLVILGHSERRAYHHESDVLVAAKVAGALRAGLEPVVCVGESLEERRAGLAVATVERQVRACLADVSGGQGVVVAYEPVWAIGSGLTPSVSEIEAVHGAIRGALQTVLGAAGGAVPILYGGSVKGANAAEILSAEHVDGALVGGASLKASDFIAIIQAA
ncbi:MAG: triose-phosphate isomerase [Caulobacteraceae bacterium]|nr:triose-phosphate isomerase [Caulobacteraceae bacterium]